LAIKVKEPFMRFILLVVGFEVVLAMLLFTLAGRVDLPWFWALLAVHAILILSATARMDAGLRSERLRPGGVGVDRGFRPLLAACLLAHLVVAALDGGRFQWSPAMPAMARGIALAVYAAGVLLSLRAIAVNRFFSPVVRLQRERGHRTVTDGPYRFVRHPGYAGMVIALVAECVVLGSLWALVPVIVGVCVLARRTALEDGFLRANLGGYAAYAAVVRYRWVPSVW
jgi:protein-S-isoprenylcysteine O-methyltransferase Ste14